MEGDGTLFAREDYVEESWRIVDPILNKDMPVYEYEANTWGPREVERVTPDGGWHNPITAPQNFDLGQRTEQLARAVPQNLHADAHK